MAALSVADSRLVDQFIDIVLQKLLDGTIDQTEARQSLKKAFSLVASGNPSVAFFLESEMRGVIDQGGPAGRDR